MAYDLNQTFLIGRLTRDVELSYTPTNNTAIAKFSIATNNGNDPDKVSFFDIVAWKKTAEICNQYLKKGSQVAISGRLQQNRFQDKEGQRRSKVEVIASSIQFIGGKPQDSGEQSFNNTQNEPHFDDAPGDFDRGDVNDDIPF